MGTVTALVNTEGNQSRAYVLQLALAAVLKEERFEEMTVAEIIGVLEILKFCHLEAL